MPLILLHGDNQIQSRSHFNQLADGFKKKGISDRVNFSGKSVVPEDVIQATQGGSFFGTQRLVTIDNLLSAPKSNRQTQIITFLSDLDTKDNHVILWESKPVTPAKLKKLPNFSDNSFKTSPIIFKFLDSFGTSNPKQTLQTYQEACQQDSAELVFYMFIKRIRQLLQVGSDSLKLAPWQLSRLKNQLRHLSTQQLLTIHQDLYWLDVNQKSGKLTLDLQSDLQMLLIKHVRKL